MELETLQAIEESVNETNTMLQEYSAVAQHTQQVVMFLGFMTVLMMMILFILMRRRGHRKIM